MDTGTSNPIAGEDKASSAIATSVQPAAQATVASAASHLKYFGHLHTQNGRQNEVVNHTNLSVIFWSDYNQLVRDLAVVKDKGNKAVISTPVLYAPSAEGGYYTLDQFAETKWLGFMNRLVADGFFKPNEDEVEQGTVIGFYPVDEPEENKLGDVNGSPSPVLVNILNIIRGNNHSQHAPIAVCSGVNYGNAIAGLKLYNWIGLDAHLDTEEQYFIKFNQLQSMLNLHSKQRMFLVPCASITPDANGSFPEILHNPFTMLSHAQSNPAVIAIVAYLWNSVSADNVIGLGEGDARLQNSRQWWDQIGRQVKYSHANAQWIGHLIPSTMIAGKPYDVRVDMRNTGNVKWELGEVFLGTQNPQDNFIWGAHRVWLPSRIEPNQTAIMVFPVMAPSTPGVYNLQGRMVGDHGNWFGDYTPNVAVNVIAEQTNAQWIGHLIPNSMVAGCIYDIRVDMRNTGNTVWELGEVFLGTQNPQDNTIWGAHRVWLPSRIQPGEIAVMVFPVRAPTTPGVYNLQGRMVNSRNHWFGDWTPNVAVSVVA
ncbi:hypothetical protein [Saezia sanguinis]|uniref:hypothetical protein n=1 Tax=Saezia sanguinis TaxID=1965230 RepID=UPI00306BEA54